MEFSGERLIIGDKECGPSTDIYQEHIKRYEFARKFIQKGQKVLDIACGSGYGAYLISQSGAAQVWGGDIDKQTVELSQKLYPGKNLHFEQMDALRLPFIDDYFDVIVSFETIEHIEHYQNFIKEIKRVLKPNGKLIISTPDKSVTEKLRIHNPFHIHEFLKKEMKDLLQPHFSKLQFYGQRPVRKMRLKQKIIQKMYFTIYRKFKLLNCLARCMPDNARQNIAGQIEGLRKDFEVKPIKKGEAYLYLIITASKY